MDGVKLLPMTVHFRPKTAVVALTTLTISLIVVSVFLLILDLRKRELAHADLETMSITRMLMEQTDEAFDGADLVLRGIQDRLQSTYGRQFPLDSIPVHLLLLSRISGMPQVSSLFIVTADGRVINSSREPPSQNMSVADREYFKAFSVNKHEDLFLGNPERKLSDRSWTLHMARKFSSPDGSFRGVVVATINLNYFEQLYEFMKLDFVRPIALYRTNGALVASLPHRENMIGARAIELNEDALSLPTGTLRSVTHISGDGTQQAFTLGRIKRFPLLVSVTNDRDEALASWRETATPIAFGAAMVSILIIVAAMLLIRELSREEALSNALRDADNRYQRTIDSVTDAIIAIDEAQTIRMFNPAAAHMFGLSVEEAIGSPLERLIPQPLRKAHHLHISGAIRQDNDSPPIERQIEMTGVHVDGREFSIESTISQTLIGGKPQLTAVLRDITLRRRAEAEQREMTRQLRELSTSLQNVREQERTRIARELHDDLGQQLTGLKLDLSWLSTRLKEGRPTPHEMLDSMRHLLDAAIATVRRIAVELRPLILDDLGFGEALAWQTREFSKRSGIEITLDIPAAESVRNDALATALFRIVQESLTNIVRHAQATHVNIRLVTEGENFVLTIIDNGRGFDTRRPKIGVGLVSMRERATALGGIFTIGNNPDGGTVIVVSVPVHQPILPEGKA